MSKIIIQNHISIYVFPFETMVMMASYLLSHINVKKLELKIHLVQF
jgi:hypothetical protein